MIPSPNDHVKCFFNNNNLIEGIVIEWSDSQAILKSLDGDSTLIIQNPKQDIMVIKIIANKPVLKEKIVEAIKSVEETSTINDRAKKLADLKILLNQQEKKIIAERLKEHNISDIKKANYEYPRFFEKQGVK